MNEVLDREIKETINNLKKDIADKERYLQDKKDDAKRYESKLVVLEAQLAALESIMEE